jgi:hypothetical protein
MFVKKKTFQLKLQSPVRKKRLQILKNVFYKNVLELLFTPIYPLNPTILKKHHICCTLMCMPYSNSVSTKTSYIVKREEHATCTLRSRLFCLDLGIDIRDANDQLICLVVGPEGGEVPQLLQHGGGLHRDRLCQADPRHEAQPGELNDM